MSVRHSEFKFHGGLHLPDHKRESATRPLQTAPLANELVIRQSQHIGEPNTPLVKVGDQVTAWQTIASSDAPVSSPVHTPVSGRVTAIEERLVVHPSGQSAPCIVIQPQPDDQFSLLDEVDPADAEALLAQIRSAGIAGLGGAVFPTAAKLSRARAANIDTLIINGAECEPWISCDDILMQTDPLRVLQGISLLQTLLQPVKTLIGIEDNKPQAIQALQQAMRELNLPHTEIVSVPTLYPSGGEKQLIKLLTGKEVEKGKLSFDIGILCQNVGTCAAIADAVYQRKPLVSRIVTVTGDAIASPGNWITPLGTPMDFLIDLAGGFKVEQPRLLMGGPMMGQPLPALNVPAVKATNTLLVMQPEAAEQTRECIRCSRCTDVCPAQLLPQQLYWYSKTHQFDQAKDYHLFDCIECGCCTAVCPSNLPLVGFYRFAKSELWEQQRNTFKSDRARKRHEFREARIALQKQQDEERRKQKREALAKKQAAEGKQNADKPQPAKDAVQAALERVKAKKQAQTVAPKNTDNLTAAQQQQIDEAEKRRQKIKDENP